MRRFLLQVNRRMLLKRRRRMTMMTTPPLFHIRQTLHQPASLAGNSHLQPPPVAVKAQKPERSNRRDEGTPSLIRSVEEDEDTDTDDVLQIARRETVVPDEPGLIGSAMEEQLPVSPFIASRLCSLVIRITKSYVLMLTMACCLNCAENFLKI
jgi:hypothetical protein